MSDQTQHTGDSGVFEGGSYIINHRDSNSVLTLTLNGNITAISDTSRIIHITSGIQLDAQAKFSFKNFFSSDEIHRTHYTGPGQVTLGSPLWGDVFAIPINSADTRQWSMRRETSLAYTKGVTQVNKRQSLKNAILHDEDLYTYEVSGDGYLWLSTLGAVDRLDCEPGQVHFVDSGHLVAWNCEYKLVKAGGTWLKGNTSGEGRILRFEGPGSIYIQSRKVDDFQEAVRWCVGDS